MENNTKQCLTIAMSFLLWICIPSFAMDQNQQKNLVLKIGSFQTQIEQLDTQVDTINNAMRKSSTVEEMNQLLSTIDQVQKQMATMQDNLRPVGMQLMHMQQDLKLINHKLMSMQIRLLHLQVRQLQKKNNLPK